MRVTTSTPGRLRLATAISLITVIVLTAVASAVVPAAAQSDKPAEGFALQVSPSPLVATVKPGEQSRLELRIRNTGNGAQELKMGIQGFKVDDSGKINLDSGPPPEAATFVSFDKPSFKVGAGEIYTQHVVVDVPASAGFSYSFAVTVSQQNPPKVESGAANIRGTVAVFTLLNVDKPGATRKLELSSFSATKRMYEYLPADFKLTFKNIGNTLVQPKGTLYVSRKSGDVKPLSTVQLNENGGFILPGSSRTLDVAWKEGLPHYESTNNNGSEVKSLSWQGGDPSKIRFGKYTAKVVAVYDDGQRDVPMTAEVSFWVIPWRVLGVILLVLILIIIGIAATLRSSRRALGLGAKAKPDRRDVADE